MSRALWAKHYLLISQLHTALCVCVCVYCAHGVWRVHWILHSYAYFVSDNTNIQSNALLWSFHLSMAALLSIVIALYQQCSKHKQQYIQSRRKKKNISAKHARLCSSSFLVVVVVLCAIGWKEVEHVLNSKTIPFYGYRLPACMPSSYIRLMKKIQFSTPWSLTIQLQNVIECSLLFCLQGKKNEGGSGHGPYAIRPKCAKNEEKTITKSVHHSIVRITWIKKKTVCVQNPTPTADQLQDDERERVKKQIRSLNEDGSRHCFFVCFITDAATCPMQHW